MKEEMPEGVHVIEENDLIKKLWALNDKYPEYVHCVRFNHASEPFHDLEECKAAFKLKIEVAFKLFVEDSVLQIARAEEEFNDERKIELLELRKLVREKVSSSLEKISHVDDLKIPDELVSFWPK